MNEYQLPEEPAGPVWDQHGSRWVRIPETYPVLWKTDDDACHPTWGRLLEEYGPLSENAPVKIGTTVPYDMWKDLPRGSVILFDRNTAFTKIRNSEWITATGHEETTTIIESELVFSPAMVARIGWGV